MLRIYLWEILVPTIVEEIPVRVAHHRLWDDKVKAIANGLTILTPTKGKWVSPEGNLISERMIPVRIACTTEQIEAISDITADHYSQREVMFYKVSDDVYIRRYS